MKTDEQRQTSCGPHGIICGHIHHAASRMIGGVHYINTGDWVESCTAVAETESGAMELIHWRDVVEARRAVPVLDPALKAA